jgi:predicted MPP superfamily phosphohydrolase
MISRRRFLTSLGALGASGLALAGYAFGVEPTYRLIHTRYHLPEPPNWPPGLHLRIAVIADLHACKPWMDLPRIEEIVARTNALDPDLVLLLGDYQASFRWKTGLLPLDVLARALAKFDAHLGTHAILGNHDWWDDERAQSEGRGPVAMRRALESANLPVYENDVVRMVHHGEAFWLAGLGDQIALARGPRGSRRQFIGVDDLPGTLAKVTDAAPVILLAHEPDIFPQVPARVSITLSGHTHGGQVRLFNYSPVVPSRFGNRYAYGHIEEHRVDGPRHLIVSGGLGCSIAPVRFGVPPEIVLVELGRDTASYPG